MKRKEKTRSQIEREQLTRLINFALDNFHINTIIEVFLDSTGGYDQEEIKNTIMGDKDMERVFDEHYRQENESKFLLIPTNLLDLQKTESIKEFLSKEIFQYYSDQSQIDFLC